MNLTTPADERVIDVKSLAELLPQFTGVILDVRQPIEGSQQGILPGVYVNIPLGELAGRASKELHVNQEIITYCAHGVRSLEAVRILQSLGFKSCRSLKGGMAAWRALYG